jgi:hypothetical protein
MAIQQHQSVPGRYVELPDLSETFADSLHTVVWDGQTLRVEFCVTRYPEAASGGEANRYPACRLVLTSGGLVALYNRLQQIVTTLAEAGVIAKTPPQELPPQQPGSA